nr:hypothetical protein [Tanacetum cinerariifolium]
MLVAQVKEPVLKHGFSIEKKDDADDNKSIYLENTDNEETDDEVVHSDEYVNDYVDEEMYDAKDVDIGKGDEEMD